MTELAGAGEAYRDYYRKVELHWSLARGNQIIVSPLEFASIESWYEAGIPLAVVNRAIDLFIEKKRKAKRKRSFLLSHAQGTVEKCWAEYKSLHEGASSEDSGDLLSKKMAALIRKLTALAKDEPEAAPLIDSLKERLRAVDLEAIVRYDDLDSQLQGLETELVTWFREHMSQETLAAFRAEIEELLDEREEPEFFQKMLNDSVRAHFALPRLTLLG